MGAIHMDTVLFEETMKQAGIVLVDFWAPWCTYCRRINAAYDKVAEQNEGSILVAKVNIDNEEQLADREKIEIIPTLVLYKDGKAVGTIVAPGSKAAIDAFIHDTLQA